MTRLFKHILIPVDFTEKNQRALQIGKQIAEQNKTIVSLLHVVETIGDMADQEMTAFYDKLKSRSIAKMEPLARQMAADGVQVEQKTVLGKPVQEIVRQSLDESIDLIVLSSHKYNAAEGKGWATLSYQVSLLCQCPVLLVK